MRSFAGDMLLRTSLFQFLSLIKELFLMGKKKKRKLVGTSCPNFMLFKFIIILFLI